MFLKECPFCGEGMCILQTGMVKTWWVTCGCTARGPQSLYEDKATKPGMKDTQDVIQ